MKNLKILFLFLFFINSICYAQVVSDRLSGISNTRVIHDNNMQLEAGQMLNWDVDYGSPLLRNASSLLLRQGISEIHEIRIGYDYEWAENDFMENYEWFSLGVKLEVANYEKLHISAIATWGFDLRSITSPDGPIYFLQLSAPWEYQFNDKVRLRSEVRFNHAYEQSDLNFGIARDFGKNFTLECGLINNLFLANRGDNGDRPYWHEFSFANVALQANINDAIALDFGAMVPLYTGAEQPDPSEGYILKGGLSIHIPHKIWRKNKVKIEPEVY
jgi:hypothetical protein